MSLTSAMMTGFTGIKSNGVGVDVVGNNLANLNTTAFKSQRTLFEDLLYTTISEGEGPSASGGGTLPQQIGSGSGVAAIQRDFRQGGFESTGFQSDLAMDGKGFFIVDDPVAGQVYTRDGAFSLDVTQTLVNSNGAAVQVFAPDADGNITTGALTPLVIPLGTQNQAVSTTAVTMDGNLNPAETIATSGTVLSDPLMTATGSASAATNLTDLIDANGVPLFENGDELVINAQKGEIAIPESIFVVGTDGSSLGDLAGQLQNVIGINADPAVDANAGVTISEGPEPPAGSIVVRSNVGEINDIQLDSASIVNRTGNNTAPFTFQPIESASGEGVTTTFSVYDSLGNPVDVRLRAIMESRSETGITWRYFAESYGDSDISSVLGSGLVTFDPNGQFVSATGADISVDRSGIGSGTPVNFTLDFSGLSGLPSETGDSQLIMGDQNGAPPGVLTNYEIAPDGLVTGVYSNQQRETLGQIAVATFVNDQGLIARNENVYLVGPNSGTPTIGVAESGTAGSIVSGALEQSNVEIAREFIGLITAQTGITAASRVVRTADDLLQELLLLSR